MQENTIINLFIEVLDNSSVLVGESLKSRFYHIWKTDIQLESLCLLLPRTTDEVSSIVKICNDNNQELIIHGGLTNLVGSTISNKTQVVISLEKMNRIIEVDESAKTITCESGVIIEDIINAVKDKNLLLPLNFGARGSAQIGGAVSTNAGGLRVFKYGMTRNLVMGIEAVLPDGTIISSLKKLMKDIHKSSGDLIHSAIESGTLLPRINNNFKLEKDFLESFETQTGTDFYGFQIISSKINNCLYILLDYGDSLGNQIFYCIKKLKRKDLAIKFVKEEYKKLKKNTDYEY